MGDLGPCWPSVNPFDVRERTAKNNERFVSSHTAHPSGAAGSLPKFGNDFRNDLSSWCTGTDVSNVLGQSWGILDRFGRSWGGLGMLLGALGALLGRSWSALGAVWGVLGWAWAVLGWSWGDVLGGLSLDRFRCRFWELKGYRKGFMLGTDTKLNQNRSPNEFES